LGKKIAIFIFMKSLQQSRFFDKEVYVKEIVTSGLSPNGKYKRLYFTGILYYDGE